ncbi:Sugar lactone lactonase YvrE [Fodinibius roseus]|uniref:Sugar lactone lactonase YvrE n=1 Tax=Fodinibius roseus TaxID=1194090 RepID=A0A1M5DDL6_9BACT|nr:SMP-30/gluconolactonase/LRE family protein [Fodinibius roseus]SHF65143.1 Sugar lactone lactonase YvrE [Fodinibius roseus]
MKKSNPRTFHLIINTVVLTTVLTIGVSVNSSTAQAQQTESYPVGNPLGLTSEGDFKPISSNVTVYGALGSAESCIYDPERELIVVPNRGAPQQVQTNNAWVSLINHDGSVHTSKWIGMQNPSQRSELSPPLVFNEPLGSTIADGILYVADRDGGTGNDDPSVAVIRRFSMETGKPLEDIRIEDSPWINDITVAEDGTIYTTQTGDLGQNPDPQTWKIWKISPQGTISEFTVGNPINVPNGIAIDPDGNIVVVNFGNPDVLTFSPDGELLKTENAVQAGGDGIEIMPDGTKYISSVRQGGISRISPGGSAELIAENIPSAASICYDPGANQLVVPMTSQHTLGFIPLD